MTCAVLVPQGKIALGKLAQATAHGARILQLEGNFDECLELARRAAEQHPIALVNSVNPARIEGQKTASFEICDQLGRAPRLARPAVGNAGNITAYWRGYCEYARDGVVAARPRMFGVQAAGAAPLVSGARVTNPETIATAIRIGSPASWDGAVAAREESGGVITAVDDEAILDAYRTLASREGVFVEPASAASVAGLLAHHREGTLEPGSLVVATVTGHGLKDPATAAGRRARPGRLVAPEVVPIATPSDWPDDGGPRRRVRHGHHRRRCRARPRARLVGEPGPGVRHPRPRARDVRRGRAGRAPGGRGRPWSSRGAGSSSAAAVAGIVAAAGLLPAGHELDDAAVLDLAAGFDGHADKRGRLPLTAGSSSRGGARGSGGRCAWRSTARSSRGLRLAADQLHRGDARPAARPRPARRRRLRRRPRRARRPRPDDRPVASVHGHRGPAAPALPASGLPRDRRLVDGLRARGVAAVVSGAGPTVLALTTDGRLPDDVTTEGFTVRALDVDTDGAVVEAV
ncbi:hypothetical protein L7F22_040122 [Adiantum nelumboides]|nr:hypothetical protein [Adiantum nelumboides]